MRVLFWHVENFKSTITEKGRSSFYEQPYKKEISADNSIVAFIAVEDEDMERENEVVEKFVKFIKKHSKTLGVKSVVIHPFAHLFVKLAPPEKAANILKTIQLKLKNEEINVERTPFGWFNELSIKAKGHPISRVARRF